MPRKATTQTPSPTGMSTPAFVATLLMIGVFIVGGAIYFGKIDKGQIDVPSTIQDSNEQSLAAGATEADLVPVVPNELRNLPNGGLISQDPNAETTPKETPKPIETEAATTPDESAVNVEEETTTESSETTESTPEPEPSL